jgi:multidrug efflux pump subunit AcrA (membrane-fusion protein)
MEADEAGELSLGQGVTLSIPQGNETDTLNGKISFISPVVDPASGLQEVKALFDNPDNRIRPGVAGHMKVESAR